MDIAQLTQFLLPFLPYLLKIGENAAEEAGKKLGEAAWEGAKALWTKLRPRVEAKPAVQKAVQDAAANPQDPDAQATLLLQLEKLLVEDAALAQELACLWESTPAETRTVIASGDRAVAIGGNAEVRLFPRLPGEPDPIPPGTLMVCPEDPTCCRLWLQFRGKPLRCPKHNVDLVPEGSLR